MTQAPQSVNFLTKIVGGFAQLQQKLGPQYGT
jgi:hypothetical protein